jgi:maltose O-acetyltransferase
MVISNTARLGKHLKIKARDILIEDGCVIGDNVEICSDKFHAGKNTRIGEGVSIISYEKFSIGENCIVGKNAKFNARSIEIGDFFYSDNNPVPLRIGGGGSNRPTARIKIGSRCVMHDSFINVAMPVEIGDDVGFSPESKVITHGFWNSVIEGYGSEFAPVKIGNHVIIGYRAIILPGVSIGDYCSIGAGAVVTRSFEPNCVIAGVPAKVIKSRPEYPKELTFQEKAGIMEKLMEEYAELLRDKVDRVILTKKNGSTVILGEFRTKEFQISFSALQRLPSSETRSIYLAFEDLLVSDKDFSINVSKQTWNGSDDEITDDLRDFLRHYGIRIFSRHFQSIPPKIKRDLEEVQYY